MSKTETNKIEPILCALCGEGVLFKRSFLEDPTFSKEAINYLREATKALELTCSDECEDIVKTQRKLGEAK